MKKKIILKAFFISFFSLLSFVSFTQTNTEEVFSFPAEFEKHEAIWMSWKTFPVMAKFKEETAFLLLKTLTPYMPVKLLIEHDSFSIRLHEEFKKRGIDKNRVQMFAYGSNPHRNTRGPGPFFLKSNKGNLMLADMKFSFYGGTQNIFGPNAMMIDTIDQYVARKLNLPIRTTTLVSEGGSYDFNGKGTMMVVEYNEMRCNKGWSRDSIENELLRMYGQKKVIWLKQGAAEDDGGKTYTLASGKVYTGGCNHIDEFVRFSSPNIVLLAEVTKEKSLQDSMHKISFDRLEANYQILKAATDQDGNPFTIIRVPTPELIVRPNGHVLATSYLNFLVTNGLVLTASYWKPGRPEIMKQKDAQAKNILEKAFPGRKVIAINVEDFNIGGGGIHCATQQQPAID